MKLSKQDDMLETGCMYMNKGIIIGSKAKDLLDEGYADESKPNEDAIGVGSYLLAQSIELLIKGLCFLIDQTPPEHHIIKHSARLLLDNYKSDCPELSTIECTLEDLNSNSFNYKL